MFRRIGVALRPVAAAAAAAAAPQWSRAAARALPLPLLPLQRGAANVNHASFRNARQGFTKKIKESKRTYILLGIPLAGFAYYQMNQETALVTHRQRMIDISRADEIELGRRHYEHLCKQVAGRTLPAEHELTRRVARVASEIVYLNGLSAPDMAWSVLVVDDPDMINAFVVPGGRIVVYTGLFSRLHSEDQLAAILAHEIAHCVLRHGAENVSVAALAKAALAVVEIALGVEHLVPEVVASVVVKLPYSRMIESEADFVGLQLMANACFNPAAAHDVWVEFDRADAGNRGLSYFRTHPTHERRAHDILAWLPEAQQYYEACHDEFGRATRVFERKFAADPAVRSEAA